MNEITNLQIYNDFLGRIVPLLNKTSALLRQIHGPELQRHPNPLVNLGSKIYSQNDEDGITLEILRRLNIQNGVFAEFGVGDGLENNTLALAAAGWGGFWVGGENLAFNPNPLNTTQPNFVYQKAWITKSNVVDLYRSGLQAIKKDRCDLISLDLDGNDYYFVQALLTSGALPEVFIVEYNAKFLPPIKFKISYDDNHRWAGDDYFGASLATYNELFTAHGYFLACCNSTGANAFFVKNVHRNLFADVPQEIEKLFNEAKYYIYNLDARGHATSLRSIEQIFKTLNPL